MGVGFWVFGYGSLMWNPEIPVAETAIARLDGFARSFCLSSVRHRGTPKSPGLVLGLEEVQAASCTGLAIRVPDPQWPEAIAALRERELVTAAYQEQLVPLALQDGRQVEAVAFVMKLGHPQYVRGLSRAEQAAIIARAHGGRGPNADYLFSTVSHLEHLDIRDPDLEGLAQDVRALLAGSTA